jgi:acetyl-CoA synthetase
MHIEHGAIDTLLLEERRYGPDQKFARTANAKAALYEQSLEDLWHEEARRRVTWFRPFDKLYEWDLPYARWFIGGELNACFNCVDRHVTAGQGEKVAYFWEGEPLGERRTLTFADLQREVVKLANGLKMLGVMKGTNVGIYMGMVPELPIAMLACARLGAPHTVVFGGFSAEALADRLNDMGCTVLITQDEAWRRGKRVLLKRTADEAMTRSPKVKSCVVLRRNGGLVLMKDGRDIWWKHLTHGVDEGPESCPCEPVDSEDLLFLMYSSGATGRPKGVMHTTGGYLVGTSSTHHYIFDIKPDTVYWCAADIGGITGHSYIVYGPLCNQTTSVLYEGTPDYPDRDRWWDIVERYKVSVIYTSSTAIRTHVKWGSEFAERHDLTSLRLLGSVGEPINPEAWVWYREHIGGDRCPIVDTWSQTETGMILIAPLPGVTTLKPGSASKPFPGVDAAIYDARGHQVGPGGAGYLVIKSPYPAMLRGLHNDPGRFGRTYWERFPGVYFTGEGARIDEDGDFWLRNVAENRALGDTTALADPAIVREIERRGREQAAREED